MTSNSWNPTTSRREEGRGGGQGPSSYLLGGPHFPGQALLDHSLAPSKGSLALDFQVWSDQFPSGEDTAQWGTACRHRRPRASLN